MNPIFRGLILISLAFSSCQSGKPDPEAFRDWHKALSVYEIMPKNYSETHNLQGVLNDLKRIRSQFITGVALLPLSPTEDGGNNYNAGDPYASINLKALDTAVADEKTVRNFIDSCHQFKLRVFLELNLSYTGPAHPWRKEKPDYYKSSEQQVDGKSNQDYVRLNLENKSVRKELLKTVDHWAKKYDWDGIVIVHGKDIPMDMWTEIGEKVHNRGKLLISTAHVPELAEQGIVDSYFNEPLFELFQKMAEGTTLVSDFKKIMDENKAAKVKGISMMYNQSAVVNQKMGSEYKRCPDCYKSAALMTYLLGGIPWVLNGQEEPMFDGINAFSKAPLTHLYNYNRDFYRAMNIHRRENPALHSTPESLPEIVSGSDNVLVIERKSGNASIVLMANLSNQKAQYTINKDYRFYTEFFTRSLVSFEPGMLYTLGPYQYLLLTNIK